MTPGKRWRAPPPSVWFIVGGFVLGCDQSFAQGIIAQATGLARGQQWTGREHNGTIPVPD
jgi:hypothetical protein